MTLPLFNLGTRDSPHLLPLCEWLSRLRFIEIFGGDCLRLQRVEVRLLPPWTKPEFKAAFANAFTNVDSGLYESVGLTFRSLFLRSRDSERKAGVRAATLVTFKWRDIVEAEGRVLGGVGGGGEAAAGGRAAHPRNPPTVESQVLPRAGAPSEGGGAAAPANGWKPEPKGPDAVLHSLTHSPSKAARVERIIGT